MYQVIDVALVHATEELMDGLVDSLLGGLHFLDGVGWRSGRLHDLAHKIHIIQSFFQFLQSLYIRSRSSLELFDC